MGVVVNKKKCISCGGCVSVCPVMALKLKDRYPNCDFSKCVNCGACVRFCPVGALELKKNEGD